MAVLHQDYAVNVSTVVDLTQYSSGRANRGPPLPPLDLFLFSLNYCEETVYVTELFLACICLSVSLTLCDTAMI